VQLRMTDDPAKRIGSALAPTPGRGAKPGAKGIESLEDGLDGFARFLRRHKRAVAALGVLLLAAAAAAGVYWYEQAHILRIAVGPPGSNDLRVIEALASNLDHDKAPLRLHIVPTEGPAASGAALAKGEANLAVVRSDIGMTPSALSVAVLRHDVLLLIVPAPAAPAAPVARAAKTAKKQKSDAGEKAAKIEKVGDLAGRRVGLVGGSPASPELLKVLLSHYGVPADKVAVSTVAPENLRNAIRENQIDAILVAGPATSPLIAETVEAASHDADEPTFLKIQADAIAKRNPAYDSVEIPAGLFGGSPPKPSESVTALGFKHYLVARKTMSDNRVASFARLVFGARQTLAAAFPGIVKIEAPSTEKDAAVPIHPGAAAYLGDTQKSFFDKYGDQIFYGLLILPFFGSGIAGVVSYFRSGSRQKRIRLINHLLELGTRARRADTMAALDHLQHEADKILKITMQRVASNELDEGVIKGLGLALDQARFAIADRRAVLLNTRHSPDGATESDAAVHELKPALERRAGS
jgi:TRAP-type uncharacterized transport system substrate-binding protein